MKTRHLLLILVSNLLSLISHSQEVGFPIIRNYTPKEYNNSTQVFCAIQDKRGIMYFGCSGSIMEYDGISWRTTPIEKLATPYDLALDKNGKIYVAANGEFGYLSADEKGNTKYKSLTHLLRDSTFKIDAIRSVKLTSKSAYFQSLETILQYNFSPENLIIYKADAGDRFSLVFIYQDTYYIKSNKNGLLKIENDQLKGVLQTNYFNDFKSIVSLPYNSTKLLIPNGDKGFYLCQPISNSVPIKLDFSNKEFIADNRIYSALEYQKNYFIFGSLKKGVVLIDKNGKTLQQYNENNFLQNNATLEIALDTTQNIWFGLNNGISKTEHSQDLSYWNKNSGLKNNVYSIIRYNNVVYISTGADIYLIDKKNQLQEVENIVTGQNWCLLEPLHFKSLLAGTSVGIYEIKGDKAIQIYSGGFATKLFQSATIPSRLFSTDNDSFISLKYDNGKLIPEGKWEGLKDDIRGIIEDENGQLWLGTFRNGVIRITPDYNNITKPKKVRYYNKKDGFLSLKEILPFRLKNRIIWGTENGLYIYNSQSDRFEPFCELGEQFCNGSRDVYSLKEMADGKIWICPSKNSKADIGYLQPNGKGGYEWVFAPFRRIPEMSLMAFYIEPSGIAWIGGSEGVYRYDIHKDTKNYSQPINCFIRKITACADSLLYGGNKVNPNASTGSEAVLSYRFNILKFEYAAPFFDQEDKILFSYKLKGYDKEWSKWSRESKKEYTNLQEGTYTFQVKAHNVYDVESEVDTYHITILPPFYRTWWAYCIYLILLALFIFTIVKLYTRLLTEQKERLKQVVKERTFEILLQKEELQAINEELESTLHSLKEAERQLIQSEKMSSLGVLAAGIAHEINNPLNFIHGGITGIEHYFNENLSDHKPNVEFYISGINEGVKRAVDIVSGLNHYSRSGDFITEKINMHSLIDNCLLILQNIIKSRIEIIRNYTDKPSTLVGNEGKLHQVIINIIANAVQAIDDQGTITIKTEIEEGKIKISITDTGSGISGENLGKILDPFFTTKEPGQGTGLGLSIANNIIQEHKGIIEFESELGKGTTAIITLPISPDL